MSDFLKLENYFYKPLSIKGDPKNIFFWSDLHYGHNPNWDEPLWAKRGFISSEEHDRILIERWNEKLNEESIIFHLGDIMFGNNGEQRLKDLFGRLNFKYCVCMGGNHHSGYKQLLTQSDSTEDGVRYIEFGNKTVYFAPNYLEAFINGQAVVMSHYAILSFNGQSKGSYMIHGHSHKSLYNGPMKNIYDGRVIDVGVENFPSPISFAEVKNLFDKKKVISYDHHNSKTQNPF